MPIHSLTADFAVAGQLDPDAFGALAQAGWRSVINNRPDGEEPGLPPVTTAMAAAEAAGLSYVHLPVVGMPTLEQVVAFTEQLETLPRPILAHCRSGTRSTVLWALASAGRMPVGEVVEAAARAGYDLSGLIPALEARAQAVAPPA